MSPTVSVIVPNYNHGSYLKERIDSILNQTFKDFELIVLDDCSTDNSRDIINEYATHPKVKKVIFNDKNSGSPFLQWRKGVALARGEWIWIAESDDRAEKEFLETLLNAIPAGKKIGIVYCDSKIIQDGVVMQETFASLKNKRFTSSRWSNNYENNGTDEIEEYLLPGGTINNTSAVLFNGEILKKADPFDMTLRYIGDKYAFVKVLAASDVQYVKNALNYFRDPFNDKHADRYVFYFYEQFLVFNWVLGSMKIKNLEKVLAAFHANTRNSLFRGWNITKVKLYGKLFHLNPQLMLRCVFHNLLAAFRLTRSH